MTKKRIGLVAITLFLGACGSSGGSTTGSSASSSTPTSTAASKGSSGATAAKTADAPKPVELTEFDLSSADPKWKGWVAKGPADAKVMADGVEGARIAAKGPSIMDMKKGGDMGFDVAFAWGKDDLKELKASIQKGADHPMGDAKVKVTFTKDDPDDLEWTLEVGDMKSYNFEIHMNVEKSDITCKNNYMVGAGNEDEAKRIMDACKSLHKKAK